MKPVILAAFLCLSVEAFATTIDTDELCYTREGVLGYTMRSDDPFKDATCSPVGVGDGCISDGGLCQTTDGKIGTCVKSGDWWNESHRCSQLWQAN